MLLLAQETCFKKLASTPTQSATKDMRVCVAHAIMAWAKILLVNNLGTSCQ